MMKYVFFIIMILVLIIFLLVSLNNFSFDKGNVNSKEKYSFLNQFPFARLYWTQIQTHSEAYASFSK